MKVSLQLTEQKHAAKELSVRIHRIKHANQVYSMERGVQMPESMTAILPESEIKHLKFFDDNFLILILSVEGILNFQVISNDADQDRYLLPFGHALQKAYLFRYFRPESSAYRN